MREYIELGSAPAEEDCAQVGSDNYYEKAKEESKKYISLLEKKFGKYKPLNCSFKRKSFPHDFGDYYEVVVTYDSDDEESMNFAYHVESNLPTTWFDDREVPFKNN